MMRTLHRRRRERGAAAVEFALILPLLAAVLFGALEYGWILLQQFNLANAVRDGVRQGVTVAQTASPDPRALAVQVAQADLLKLGVPSTSVVLTATYAGSSPTKTITLSGRPDLQEADGLRADARRTSPYSMTMMLELQ